MHHRSPALLCAVIALSASVLGACGSSTASTPAPATPSGAASGRTVWLCRPGEVPDPCTGSLATTVVPATGPRTVAPQGVAGASEFDCFYVYPTVSTEPTANADLTIQAPEIAAAASQAAPFSPVCRVYTPMYRQRTVASLSRGLGDDPGADQVAYSSLLAGWTTYLAHDNDGRPVVFIGHSQGAAMLIRLLADRIDDDPSLRSRMVSAIIAGGNVAVPMGRAVGSTFRHLPLCTSAGQDGCVIAYSSFPGQPPASSLFGRPGTGVSLQSGQTATAGVQVACVDPAALDGGAGLLDPLFRSATQPVPAPPVTTPWVTYPGLYSAECRSADGATWLQVDTLWSAVASRPTVTESLGPDWGYHLDDINLAAGNLVQDVRAQEATYARSHP